MKGGIKITEGAYSQSDILIEIESLVRDIIRRAGAFDSSWSRWERRDYGLAVMRALPRLLTFYAHQHEYSEHIVAFWHACEKLGWLNCGRPTWMVSELGRHNTDPIAVMGELSRLVLDFSHGKDFRRRSADRLYEQKEKRKRLDDFTQKTLSRYARTLILRVDLGYRKGCFVDIAEVFLHLDQFRDLIRGRRAPFLDNTGHVISVEQGETKGYHLHVCVFLPGHLHQRDGYLAKHLGEAWVGITNGAGAYHSCNARKELFERNGRRGVGMIYRDDALECANAVRAVGYLAEPDKEWQHLRMKPEGRRGYFMGN